MKTVFADAAAPEDSAPVTKIASKNLAKLTWKMVKPYKKWLLLIFIAMLVETAMSLAAPWPLKIIIDDVIGHHHLPHWLLWMNKIFPAESKVQFAAIAAISVILIAVISALAGYVDSYFTESVAQYVANDLRRLVYHHLQQLSLSYYDTHQTGKLLSTITADVSTIQDFASSTLMNIVVDVLTIFFMMGLMLYLNTSFTLVIICLTPFLLFFISRFKKVMKKATHEVRVDQSTMFTVLQQGLESIRTINAFGRQAFEEDHLKKISLQTVGAALKARRVKSMLSPFVTIIVAVCTAVVLWRASDLVLKGTLTIGALTVYLWYMNRFFSPVQDLAKMTTLIAQATVALERIQAILDTGLTIQERTGAVKPNRLNGDILFDDVSFAYNSGEPVLKHINLEICCGQRIGICGYTGCGKSTLVSLIARFYDATGGKILIDGVDINDYTLDGLRAQVGFVLQDTVLFYGSIRDNIGYGKLDAADEEIIAAAKMANAHEFIAQMPNGYNTLVGERGLTLSGGQRQRIGIARAVMRNAPVLVLDEPTAALDTESEILVMNALENLMEGRTVITIAHRLSTICSSDKIVVLNKGSIAEEGTHEELLVKKGIYADLYNMQAQASHKLRKLVAEQ